MIDACLRATTHYFDITGELRVFEHAHSQDIDNAAKDAGILICPGIAFDVVPTDCLAKALIEELPDATELELGFEADMAISPGTARSMVEGIAQGTIARVDGELTNIPLIVKNIDFGNGERQSMSVSWGDVSTAFYTTGIRNITVFWPASNADIRQVRMSSFLRPVLRLGRVQNFLKKQIDKRVSGPSEERRGRRQVLVWGQVRNAAGEQRTARVRTANVYTVTQLAPVAIIERLADGDVPTGSITPAKLLGKDFVSELPGSSSIEIS